MAMFKSFMSVLSKWPQANLFIAYLVYRKYRFLINFFLEYLNNFSKLIFLNWAFFESLKGVVPENFLGGLAPRPPQGPILRIGPGPELALDGPGCAYLGWRAAAKLRTFIYHRQKKDKVDMIHNTWRASRLQVPLPFHSLEAAVQQNHPVRCVSAQLSWWNSPSLW